MFDPTFFATQLRREVDKIAEDRYQGDRPKAFAFWAIRLNSSALTDDEVEFARGLCEQHGPGDEGIDGCWLEGDDGPFYMIQTKWAENMGMATEDVVDEEGEENGDTLETVSLKNFPKRAAQELWSAFGKVHLRSKGKGVGSQVSQKLLNVTVLYNRALKENRQVRLRIVIAGKYGDQLGQEVALDNARLRESSEYHGHFMDIVDFNRLNQMHSERIAPPPGPVLLRYVARTLVPGKPTSEGRPYAYALTVGSRELVRIRAENRLNIFHDNFRFVLKNSSVRKGMLKTLADARERRNFWRYNNGITVVCTTAQEAGASALNIEDFQVVNGLQTIEALHDFAGLQHDDSWMDDVFLQLRVIPTASPEPNQVGPSLEERIAEYSNSQNPIKPRDLRSNDAVQKEIDADMNNFGLRYGRKEGMYRKAEYVVDNVRAAQYALAFWGLRPRAAKNARRLLFVFKHDGGFYEDVFVRGATKAPWLLVPYFFYSNYDDWAGSMKSLGSLPQYGNLLALSLVGHSFMQVLPYENPVAVDDAAYAKLKDVVEHLRELNSKGRKLRELWRPAYDVIAAFVKEEQKKSEERGIEPPSDRRIAVKLDFGDLKPRIPSADTAVLPERIRRLLDSS